MEQINYAEANDNMSVWMKTLVKRVDAQGHVLCIQQASNWQEFDCLRAEFLVFLKKYSKPRILARFMPKGGTLEGLADCIIETQGQQYRHKRPIPQVFMQWLQTRKCHLS